MISFIWNYDGAVITVVIYVVFKRKIYIYYVML